MVVRTKWGAADSEIAMSRPEGHPRGRFPLAVYLAPMADSRQEAAVKRAVEDWNSVFCGALGITAFRWATRAAEVQIEAHYNAFWKEP